eukprot:CAMPEP_0118980716 /NCGR_PEP_ID=MMETSP1173-20130426/28981_1 /TAXON_ID=1034831 /ORGANISM="Rhizochromulina marina cf, Strain CCMP1243" /LENGTH=539 /DNA_ID=CAMNT_0006931081 /DNA_START=15 /DNA_END=1634 /DNA_ORIENTATION=+
MEEMDFGRSQVKAAVETSLTVTSHGPSSRLAILMGYCDFSRRQLITALSAEDLDIAHAAGSISFTRAAFASAAEHLRTREPDFAEGLLAVYQYHAALEQEVIGPVVEVEATMMGSGARGVWEACVASPAGALAGSWTAFAMFEGQLGGCLAALAGSVARDGALALQRTIFERGFQRISEESPEWNKLCEDWERFERRSGTLEDLRETMEQIHRARVEKEKRQATRDKTTSMREPPEQLVTASAAAPIDQRKRKQPDEAPTPVQTAAKKARPSVEQDVEAPNGDTPSASPGLADGDQGDSERPVFGKEETPPAWPTHPTTVWVKGLAVEETQESLSALFSPCGPIMACRIMLDKRTRKPRGEGMVQFEHAWSVPGALNLPSAPAGDQETRQRLEKLTVQRSKFPALAPRAKSSKKLERKGKGAPEERQPQQQARGLKGAKSRPPPQEFVFKRSSNGKSSTPSSGGAGSGSSHTGSTQKGQLRGGLLAQATTSSTVVGFVPRALKRTKAATDRKAAAAAAAPSRPNAQGSVKGGGSAAGEV